MSWHHQLGMLITVLNIVELILYIQEKISVLPLGALVRTEKEFVSVETQGRNGVQNEWVTEYTIGYSNNGVDWCLAENGRIFVGNKNTSTIVKNKGSPKTISTVTSGTLCVYYCTIQSSSEVL